MQDGLLERSEDQMTNRWRMAGLVLAVAAAPSLAGCGSGDVVARAAAEDTSGTTATMRVVNVEVVKVGPEVFVDAVSVTGTVEADRDIVVASEEGGVIREVAVAKGRRVAAGQPIAMIDDRLLRAQYDQMQAEARLAEETWQRQRRLWEEDSIGSELSYLQAKYRAETSAASARAAETRLERTTVRAPIAGVLDDRFVEVGSTVAVGSPVARIIDADPLKVVAGVPERYAGQVRTGSAAMVSFESGAEVEGRVSFVGTAVDGQNRTFEVEVEVPNRSGDLKPGMVANLLVQRGDRMDAILVPRDAVLRGEAGYIVYVVEQSEGSMPVAVARIVRTGSGAAGRVVIEEGLNEGDRVIITGQQQVAAGDRVRITNAVEGGAS